MSKTGGPAFPQNDAAVNRINNETGMTLRDYFAGQALVGLAMRFSDSTLRPHAAETAYAIAEDMIAERDKAND